MHSNGPKPTKAEVERWRWFAVIGCIACWLFGEKWTQPEAHHLNEDGKAGQKRRGHSDSIPLCRWHHRGVPLINRTAAECRKEFGPSLKHESCAFRARFGTDDELRDRTNERINEVRAGALGHPPREIARHAQTFPRDAA